jgi:hypothetical protein
MRKAPVLAGQTIVLDYPVVSRPRYVGNDPHPQLYALLDAKRDDYADQLVRMLNWKQDVQNISLHDPDPRNPAWDNGFLPGLDALALYSFLRETNAKHFIEIGSGASTKFARRAIQDGSLQTHITSIDPSPRASIDELCDTVIRHPLEACNLNVFDVITAGDIVFMDGSHRVFMNSDATVFWLEVLPKLPPGVLVEVHDIYIPYDYPMEWADRWYSEQYLLATQLLFGATTLNVILPSTFISNDANLRHSLDELWNLPNLAGVERHGGSFWFMTRSPSSG